MQFVKNESLKVIKPGYLGNPMLNGRFLNYQKVTAPSVRDILRWRFTKTPSRIYNKQHPWHAPLCPLTTLSDKSQDRIIWLGHASFLITLNGKTILTDPVFFNIPLIKRLVGLPCQINQLINIDYILISHSHFDHIDKRSLQQIAWQNPQAKIYCGLNHASLFNRFAIANPLVEASWYQQFPLTNDNLEFYFLPALHWSKRTAFDRNKRLWGSFMIKSNTVSIYFMGDSGYSPHFKEIGSLFDGLNYCLMGIGAYEPSRIMQNSHTNPDQAIQGFDDLKGEKFIPMHYGTYNLADEPLAEPLQLLKKIIQRENRQDQVIIPKIGEVNLL